MRQESTREYLKQIYAARAAAELYLMRFLLLSVIGSIEQS
jgi:hypothetical protein